MAMANKVTLEAIRAREAQNLALAKMSRVGQILSNETGKSENYYADFLIQTLEEWTEQLGIPKFSDYGVKASDLETIVTQTSNRNNPIKLTREEIFAILSSRLIHLWDLRGLCAFEVKIQNTKNAVNYQAHEDHEELYEDWNTILLSLR